ncbi:uncharacterized protein LAESUDRAFT_564487 [Laetiporus sulphureus 93-53]|uniref:Uncharacterized protein n=1 Tax=Laetiporus sulphureus 93-53 TaxID=1314785 RepID=A0A165FEB3_9APHY|nr:uncharacterized protein LAESUDRAFT_564487 [Laetiporus sulphureus 93-53]KZT08839.1 hypothetical protein LAESUDRAFT_564487 [Laetiporus sulphureus 93-53]
MPCLETRSARRVWPMKRIGSPARWWNKRACGTLVSESCQKRSCSAKPLPVRLSPRNSPLTAQRSGSSIRHAGPVQCCNEEMQRENDGVDHHGLGEIKQLLSGQSVQLTSPYLRGPELRCLQLDELQARGRAHVALISTEHEALRKPFVNHDPSQAIPRPFLALH